MSVENKFTIESHRAANGAGIEFITNLPVSYNGEQYHSRIYTNYPIVVVFKDGYVDRFDEKGCQWFREDGTYDLVPICPFSSKTHVREDGKEIDTVRPLASSPGVYRVGFVNGSDYAYLEDGSLHPECKVYSEALPIITREEYAARKKASEPFTVDNCLTESGLKLTHISLFPSHLGNEPYYVGLVEGKEGLYKWFKTTGACFFPTHMERIPFNLVKI